MRKGGQPLKEPGKTPVARLFEARAASASGSWALGAMSLGALAAGAVAGGAVAIGALAIRRLAVKRGRIGHLSIEELKVDRLHVRELVTGSRREPHPFDFLEGHEYVRLTSFRRSGEPVSTPLWFVSSDGRLYATTPPDSGKMKRVRNDPDVVLAPCNVLGRPRGRSVEGVARRLEDGEAPEAASRAFWEKYGLKLSAVRFVSREEMIGQLTLEVRPAEPVGENGDGEEA